MNDLSSATAVQRPTSVRYGVLGFACALSMITYLDRVCFGTVAPFIQGEFGLTDDELGWLFTAFALAYAVFEVPTGWLGDVFGARVTLVRIVLWWSFFTALTGLIYPSVITGSLKLGRWELGWAFLAMFATRFLFGIGEAGAYPNISAAFSKWFPFGERGRAQGAVWMAGRFAGGVSPWAVTVLTYATLAEDGTKITHWRHIFWVFGAIGVVWCVAFWWWFRDHPRDHPSVNEAERALIEGKAASVSLDRSAGARRAGDEGIAARQEQLAPAAGLTGVSDSPPAAPADHGDHSHSGVPWGKLLGNLNLWTLCLMYFCAAYGWYFNITWLPKYLRSHFEVTPESHGAVPFSLMAGAPLLVGATACLVGGLFTDAFIRRTGDRKWGRRLFGMVGHGVCALCYFLSLTAGSPWVFVFFVAMAAFWNDLTMGSAWASCIDIGGRYSGIVSGCMNTIGNLGGAVAGISTGYMLRWFGTETGWTINFISFGTVYVLAVFLWLRFDATKKIAE